MAAAEVIGFDTEGNVNSHKTIHELLMRLQQIRRRLERWMPSSHSVALWSHDYSEVLNAAKRLEATVGELVSELSNCAQSPNDSVVCLGTLLDQLESRTNDFEVSIVRNVAIA